MREDHRRWLDKLVDHMCSGGINARVVPEIEHGEVGVMVIRGAAMAAPVRAAIADQGGTVDDDKTYRLAMPNAYAGDADLFGEPESVEATGTRVRGVYESWIRRRGLTAVA